MTDELAQRAHRDLAFLWSPIRTIELQRALWLIVMKEQRALGVDIPDWAIGNSQLNLLVDRTTLDRIRQRELRTRHDLKASLEVFCEDAGHEYHHLGLTSADIVENVYQVQVRRSLEWLESYWPDVRFPILQRYPMRGIKGPMGTQSDQVELLGSVDRAQQLDWRVAQSFGFESVAAATGQVMHRSLDLAVVTDLLAGCLTACPDSPLRWLLLGFETMAAALAGDTWNEGDVSHSSVRRYALPGAVFAYDVARRGWDQ